MLWPRCTPPPAAGRRRPCSAQRGRDGPARSWPRSPAPPARSRDRPLSPPSSTRRSPRSMRPSCIRLAQVARLVPTDRRVIDELAGDGFLDRLLAAGVPLAPLGRRPLGPARPRPRLLLTRWPHPTSPRCVARRIPTSGATRLLPPSSCSSDSIERDAAAAAARALPRRLSLDAIDILEYQAFVDRIDARDARPPPGRPAASGSPL